MSVRISAIALACWVGLSFGIDPRLEQGARFVAKGEYEKALGEYRDMLAENPKNADAYYAAAQVRMKMKDFLGALANFRLAYKSDPNKSEAYEGAAMAYESLGQRSMAAAERAKDPKNNPEVDVATVAEAIPAAVPTAEPAKSAEPAEVAEAKPAEVKPDSPKPAEVAEVKPVEVKPVESKPVEVVQPVEAPKPVEAKPAEQSVEKVVETLPTDPFEKGKALFAEGKFKEAAPVWREVLRKQPNHAGAYFYAGLTRYELGEYDKAEFNLKKGLEYKDEGNDANYFLALIAQKQNKADQELKYLANYIKKAAPGAKYRKSAEERLAAIKATKSQASTAETSAVEIASAPAEKVEAAAASTPVASPAASAAPAPHIADAPSGVPTIANANLLYSAGSYEAALQMYKALLETEQNMDERYFTMLQMGNAYRELRDFHSAVVRYREVVQQFPDSDWATEAERALEDAVWLEKHASELPRKIR